MQKVAHLAGVSKTTAANVLHNRGKASDETRRRVLQAADSINYRLNSAASGLSRGKSNVVGVLVADYVPGMMLSGISAVFVQACSQAGLVVSFASEDKVQDLISSGIDALLVIGQPSHTSVGDLELPYGLPVISLETIPGQPAWASHNPDDIASAVAKHFAQQGCTHFGWLLGPGVEPIFNYWTESLARIVPEHDMAYSAQTHDASSSDVARAVTLLIDDGVDGIYSAMAWTPDVRDALVALDKSIPNDVLLVAQSEGLTELAMAPQVSTLSLMTIASGLMIADSCIKAVNGQKPEPVELPFELHVRESSQAKRPLCARGATGSTGG